MFSHRQGEWVTDPLSGAEQVLSMPEIGADVPLTEIYDGIEFPEAPPA